MKKTEVLSYSTGVLLSLIGFGGIAAGLGLMLQPDGGGLGFTLTMLENSPFEDFFIPGIFLFTVNGMASLVGAFFAFKDQRYSGLGTAVLGVAMIIWIVAEVYWIGWVSWLQPTFLVVGAIELGLGYFLNAQHPENHGMFTHHHGTPAH